MLPPEFVITSTLKVGVVYKMTAPELITTAIPHYFVVVAINDSTNYMLLGTTQLQSKIEHLTRRGYDLKTLAYIRPNEVNGLTADSYFNCNDTYDVSKEQLVEKVTNGLLTISGHITQEEYDSLVYSMNLSEVNDIPNVLFIYERD